MAKGNELFGNELFLLIPTWTLCRKIKMRMKLLFLYVPGLSSALDVEAKGDIEARGEIQLNTYSTALKSRIVAYLINIPKQ